MYKFITFVFVVTTAAVVSFFAGVIGADALCKENHGHGLGK